MFVSGFGRIGRDAELRYTAGGDAVCSIAVACDFGRKDETGKKPIQWIELTLWGKQASNLAEYLIKGRQVYFNASDCHVETFTKRDGTTGHKLVARCIEIKFAYDGSDARHEQQAVNPAPQASTNQTTAAQYQVRQGTPYAPAQTQAHTGFDDDIPF